MQAGKKQQTKTKQNNNNKKHNVKSFCCAELHGDELDQVCCCALAAVVTISISITLILRLPNVGNSCIALDAEQKSFKSLHEVCEKDNTDANREKGYRQTVEQTDLEKLL